MTRFRTIIHGVLLVSLLAGLGLAQNSGRIYRRSGILNGNQVKTVFGNWGVIGQPSTRGPRGAWIYDTNGYIGDVSPLVGAEARGQYTINSVTRDTVFFWVIDCPVARPSTGGFDTDLNGTRQALEPVAGYFNESGDSPAISSNPDTWPPSWPDKSADWDGYWNGMFGKLPNADLETYFVMNDNNDNEFNDPIENPDGIFFNPDPDNLNRKGLGLEVKVRGLQWQQILAQDNIFWVYEIKNQGQRTYPRTIFGMLVGTYVGVTGSDDSPQEYDDDWSFFDVNEDLTYTGDYPGNNARNPFWQGAVGLVGYAFLESPGNPFDGLDNDNDADQFGTTPVALYFTENDFIPTTFTNSSTPGTGESNKVVVLTDTVIAGRREFLRSVLSFPTGNDTFEVVSMGESITLISGETTLSEGEVILVNNEQRVNPNAYDGKDNDLDGLIDENYFLHYRQRRVTPQGSILFDLLNPVRYVNYVAGIGTSDAMIDERRDDGIDNDGDWSRNSVTGQILVDADGNFLDDVGVDGIPGTGDTGENDRQPTAGEPNFDQTDKDESDQIGLSSFDYFVPSGTVSMLDDIEMWQRLEPGYFAVPSTFINGRPTQGEDGDFIYGSGYFPLTPGQTERMSLALIYGWDLEDMVNKLRTVQKIYNSDYRFPIAPDKPTLTAIAGDDSVVLYWDRVAEKSFDPVLRQFDFEGYKIYRATDPNFNDARVITNSQGNVVAFKPIAQFDLIDNIYGWFYPNNDIYQILQGWAFDLGDETGLEHSYVDYDAKNGRTYYYAVVSYDKGVDSSGIIPSECTKNINQLSTGEISLDYNTAMVTPSKPAAGYDAPPLSSNVEHTFGDGFGTVDYEILDPTKLTGHDYLIYFWDTSNDGIDNNKNWTVANDVGADELPGTFDEGEGDGKPTIGEPNLDIKDIKELEAITTHYAVQDQYQYKEEIQFQDTLWYDLSRANLVEGSILVQDGVGNVIPDSLYEVDLKSGRIRALQAGIFDGISTTVTYQHHPIYFSEYMQGSPWVSQVIKDTDIFDGLTLNFDNIWKTSREEVTSAWSPPEVNYSLQFAFEPSRLPNGDTLRPVFFPSNYELRISDHVVDTTTSYFEFLNVPSLRAGPRKFEIINTTGGYKIEYFHADNNRDSLPSALERIAFFEKDNKGDFTIFTWQFQLVHADTSELYQFVGGEVLTLEAPFPFNKFDKFEFRTEVPVINSQQAKADLDLIKVVPNPYIAAHEFEPNLPPSITSGRGERRLYFTNIPVNSKIHIFTARGDHVITLQKDNSITDGTVIWDMKTRENLDIAFGVYFYVVDSSVGNKRGKFAVIK
jgi:hypothetical protein